MSYLRLVACTLPLLLLLPALSAAPHKQPAAPLQWQDDQREYLLWPAPQERFVPHAKESEEGEESAERDSESEQATAELLWHSSQGRHLRYPASSNAPQESEEGEESAERDSESEQATAELLWHSSQGRHLRYPASSNAPRLHDPNAATVYYPSPHGEGAPLLSTGELLVHFHHPISLAEAEAWAATQPLRLLAKARHDHAILLACGSRANPCIEESNRLRQLPEVRLAYPNWQRRRHHRATHEALPHAPREGKLVSAAELHQRLTRSALQLSAQQQQGALAPGQRLSLQVVIHNPAIAAARELQLTLTPPPGLRLDPAHGLTPCSGSAPLRCRWSHLAADQQITLTLPLIAERNGLHPLQLRLEAANAATQEQRLQILVRSDGATGGDADLTLPPTWNDPLFSAQWYLDNERSRWGASAGDLNLLPAWQRGLRGHGVTLAIIDDGLELEHEDLIANSSAALSWDYMRNRADVNLPHHSHGTAVAGLIAATGNNNKGIVGVAPAITLVGIRAENTTDYVESLALDHNRAIDLYNNSWGPEDGGHSLDGPGPLARAALEAGIRHGRSGKGQIYCWAAGNGGLWDNANYDGYANSRYTIAIGAFTDSGRRAYYSEPGANLLVVAPSDGGFQGITTTDRTKPRGYNAQDHYTHDFGGTSASTALACGAAALVLEANPALTWRDLHYLLAVTAAPLDLQDHDWSSNGVGYLVNHNYGFGAIDTAAATRLAPHWPLLAPEITATASARPNRPIPDHDLTGVSSSVTIDRDLYLESVEITFNADDHPYWGDLEITLTSPSGSVSRLAELHDSGYLTARYRDWTFLSKRHLGENGRGQWTLRVRDLAPGDRGTFKSWSLRLYGTATPPPIPSDSELVDLLPPSPGDTALPPQSLRLVTSGPGTIRWGSPEQTCSGTCDHTLPRGQQLELHAIPAIGPFRFQRWGGACSGQGNPCRITLFDAQEVHADFLFTLRGLFH